MKYNKHPNGGGMVADTATVDPAAYVGPDACVYGDARVYGDAYVYGVARVCGNAYVYGDARVSGGEWSRTPLYVAGPRHAITNSRPGHFKIGCHEAPFDWWLTKAAEQFARGEGYSDEDIAWCRAVIGAITPLAR